MSTVGTSAALGSLVNLNVLNDEVACVETLGVGVSLGVLEETEQLLSGLDGPAGSGDTESLAYTHISDLVHCAILPVQPETPCHGCQDT